MYFPKIIAPLALVLALAACDSPEDRAAAYFERGQELLAAGDTDRAEVEFRNAVQELPTHIEARLALARLNEASGNTTRAFKGYMRVAEQDPTNLEALIAVSQMAFIGQNWEAFERYSASALELAPQETTVQILDVAGRYRTARIDGDSEAWSSILAEAEALKVKATENELLRQVLIDGYLAENRFSDALTEINKALADAPASMELHVLKVRILAEMGDDAGVEQELRRMIAETPDSMTPRSNLLNYLLSRQRFDAAEDFLREIAASEEISDTDRYSATVALVQFLLNQKGREAAMEELDARIAAQPDAYVLRALKASLAFDSGNRDSAISSMEQIIADAEAAPAGSVDPEQIQNIRVTLATMLSNNGNDVGARRMIEDILADDPDVVSALKMQATWMIQEDNTDGAINALRTALAASPQDVEAMTLMAQAYQRAGRRDLMVNFLSLAVEASNNAPANALRYAAALREDDKALQAEAALIASLRLHPGNVDVLEALGIVYLELEDIPRAEQVLSSLRKIETDQARSAATALQVRLLALQQDTGELMSFLENLAAQDGGNDSVRLALIQGRLENGEIETALEMAQELVTNNPDNVSYAYFQALALASAQRFDAATEALNALLETHPQIEAAWTLLARLTGIQGTSEDVHAVIDAGLAATRNAPNLLWAKASLLQQQNDIDGAIAIYEDLYARNSDSIVVANNLASLLTTFRRDAESLERAQRIARRLQGTDVPAFQDTYGWILVRNGEAEKALEYLEPAAAALTEDAAVQYHLARAYQDLGRREDALAQMRLAMDKLGPLGSTELAKEIREQMALLEAGGTD